jgi:undecaprenyl-diphosphatase
MNDVIDETDLFPIVHQRRAALVFGIAGLALTVVVGLVIRHTPAITRWDQDLLIRINTAHWSGFDALTTAFNTAFSPLWATILTVMIALIIGVVTRRVGIAIVFAFTAGWIYAPLNLIKLLIARPRPARLPYVPLGTPLETSFSFPSGHVTMACAVVAALFLVTRAPRHRVMIGVIGGLVVVATAFSRMYVGAHYLTDVVASVLLATSTAAMMFVAVSSLVRWSTPPRHT